MSADREQPLVATNYIVDSYEKAIAEGVPPETVATAALSTALGLMVQIHGEDVVAKMLEEMPAKVRSGQFTHS